MHTVRTITKWRSCLASYLMCCCEERNGKWNGKSHIFFQKSCWFIDNLYWHCAIVRVFKKARRGRLRQNVMLPGKQITRCMEIESSVACTLFFMRNSIGIYGQSYVSNLLKWMDGVWNKCIYCWLISLPSLSSMRIGFCWLPWQK